MAYGSESVLDFVIVLMRPVSRFKRSHFKRKHKCESAFCSGVDQDSCLSTQFSWTLNKQEGWGQSPDRGRNMCAMAGA